MLMSRKGNDMIKLRSKVQVVSKIIKKTQAIFFKNLKIGHEIEITAFVRNPGRGRGLYATSMRIGNITTGEEAEFTMTVLAGHLAKFEFQEDRDESDS